MKTSSKVLIGMLIFSSHYMSAQTEQENLLTNTTGAIEVVNMSRYDYFPNLQAYYDRKTQLFIYLENGVWVSKVSIPTNYRGYCVRNGLHVVIDNYSGDEPYASLASHKLKYPADYSTKRQRAVVASVN